jgi:PleD family two-component response regulator
MQEEIARLAISHETSTVSGFITLSIGIATMILIPDQRVSPTTLINIADNALYEAKANGRNQIVLREFEPIHLF